MGQDTLSGLRGSDVLDGAIGADTMIGGQGNDTYHVDDAGDTVVENASEGRDTVLSSISYTLGANIENLILTGTADLAGTGNHLNNTVTGNSGTNILRADAGDDTLDGAAGADTMIGGLGNDTYVVDTTGDVVVENAGEGTDTVQSSISYRLGAEVENLVLTGTANLVGLGNHLNNTITGNSGANILRGGLGDDNVSGKGGNDTLDGGGGLDTMAGGTGDDTYYVDHFHDVVIEAAGEGNDTVYAKWSFNLGSQAVETLILTGTHNSHGTGSGIANTIIGNAGNNVLNGMGGDDTLTGGLGADTFLFKTGSGHDTIADFSAAQNDSINVHAYAHGHTHYLWIAQNGGDVVITLDASDTITVTGATVADVSAHMVW